MGPQAWDPPRPGLQGPCASLSKSGLGPNQLHDFGRADRAIPDRSFLLCKMGGMKDLPRGAATCQEPPGDRRRIGLGSWGRRGSSCLCSAPEGHRGHAPTPAAGRGPRLQRVAKETSRRSSEVGRTGTWHGRPPPCVQYLRRGPHAG